VLMLNVWLLSTAIDVFKVRCHVWFSVVPFSNVPFGYAYAMLGLELLIVIVIFIMVLQLSLSKTLMEAFHISPFAIKADDMFVKLNKSD